MDRLFAPTYDEDWGTTIAGTHRRFIERFLRLCPVQARLLDAACGTGKYWPVILASGRTILAIDQSQGMLDRASAKFPGVKTAKIGLQEMRYRDAFDGAICIDAMEYVFPEDWPSVLGNFRRAIKPAGPLYFTVELPDEDELRDAFAEAQKQGMPVVPGEYVLEGAYHYFPPLSQIRKWIDEAGFLLLDEELGDAYRHFLVRSKAEG